MTLSITHQFISGIADGADTSLVRPSNWNATHTITGAGALASLDTVTVSLISDASANGRSFISAANYAAMTALLPAMVGDSGSGGTKGLVPAPATGDATKFLRGDGTYQTVSASPGGSTTQVQYNSSGAFAGAAGFVFDGTSKVTLGVAGSSVGGVALSNATSGTVTLNPPTGALGSAVITTPGVTSTLAILGANTFTAGQTITEAVGSSALTLTGATQTTSQPVINATQTWNNAGVTFTGWKLNVTSTASAASSLLMDLQAGGVTQFGLGFLSANGANPALWISNAAPSTSNYTLLSISNTLYVNSTGGVIQFRSANNNSVTLSTTGIQIPSTGIFSFSSTADPTGTNDVKLDRDVANTLALRNGTTAQKYSVYNTWTDASNYERGVFDWAGTANVLSIGTENAGTGSTRNIQFLVGGTLVMDYGVTSAASWTLKTAGSVRMKINSGTSYIGTGVIQFGQNSVVPYVQFDPQSDGVMNYIGGVSNTSVRINFGGGSSSFPAIKRSTTNLQARLADDSGYCGFEAGTIGAGGVVSATTFLNLAAGTTGVSPLRFIQGAAPTSPVDGDMWREDNTNTGLKVRINGVTKTVTVS